MTHLKVWQVTFLKADGSVERIVEVTARNAAIALKRAGSAATGLNHPGVEIKLVRFL